MTSRRNLSPAPHFDLAAFLAILATAIILISAVHPDPVVVQSLTDLVTAYLVGRIATEHRRDKHQHRS
jgi:hypothetical protein